MFFDYVYLVPESGSCKVMLSYWSWRVPRYVLGSYIRFWLLRSVKNRIRKATARANEGAKVDTSPEIELLDFSTTLLDFSTALLAPSAVLP